MDKKNYINYVKDEEILRILNSVGLEPLEDNYDDNGELIPWIERGDNVIMVRAKNTEDKYADIRASAAQCKKFIPFLALATTIDKIEKTKVEQKRIYDSIDALSEKINIMLGLDKTSVAIENLKAETAPIYIDGKKPVITSEEDLTWNCPDCGNEELLANTICTKCGYDKNNN